MKVIHILTTSPSTAVKDIDWQVFDGWHARTAKKLKAKEPGYEYECWCPELTQTDGIRVEERDGITYKVFPSKLLMGRIGWEKSPVMIAELRKNPRSLVHVHGIHYTLSYSVIKAAKKAGCKIILQHHGNSPKFSFSERPIRKIYEQFVLKHADYAFAITRNEEAYLKSLIGNNKVRLQGMGLDFERFTPGDKMEARKRLNLPEDKKILLYVGRLYQLKGVQYLLNLIRKLKKKNKNYELVMVGGEPGQQYYDSAVESGAIVRCFTTGDISDYFRAADVYLSFVSPVANGWLGFLIAAAESLACNTPYIGNTYIVYSQEDLPIDRCGAYWNPSQSMNKLIRLVDEVSSREYESREVIRHLFDWDVIIGDTLKTYKEILGDNNQTETELENL